MALHRLRLRSGLRRILSISSSVLLHNPLIVTEPVSLKASDLLSPAIHAEFVRPFTSTNSLLRKAFDPENDDFGPDTILFEGCDYNHWLITMDFKDAQLTREQMIEAYVNTATKVFGSVEEAKKNIYALSTTTYQGFQVICSEENSEKFKNIPDVVFVLPDSYIDPANKEYGGDKYVNGEIFPRPPPIHYRNTNRRRPREPMSSQQGNSAYNYQGPMHSDESRPPPQQQNYRPPRPQHSYGSPGQHSYGTPGQHSYGANGPPPQENYSPPAPQQNYGLPPNQQNYQPWPQQSNGSQSQWRDMPPQQRSYGNPTLPPQQNHGLSGPSNASRFDERNQAPSYHGNGNQALSYHGNGNQDPDNYFAQGPLK